MSVERLQREFRYDDWANREVLRHLVRDSAPPPRALAWLAHVLGAQSVWLSRLRGTPSALAVWPRLTPDECAGILSSLREDWAGYLAELSPAALGKSIEYRNSKGEPWSSRVEDVLAQVLFHGAYHRGQIASELREAGMSPPLTDYIHARRSGAVE